MNKKLIKQVVSTRPRVEAWFGSHLPLTRRERTQKHLKGKQNLSLFSSLFFSITSLILYNFTHTLQQSFIFLLITNKPHCWLNQGSHFFLFLSFFLSFSFSFWMLKCICFQALLRPQLAPQFLFPSHSLRYSAFTFLRVIYFCAFFFTFITIIINVCFFAWASLCW